MHSKTHHRNSSAAGDDADGASGKRIVPDTSVQTPAVAKGLGPPGETNPFIVCPNHSRVTAPREEGLNSRINSSKTAGFTMALDPQKHLRKLAGSQRAGKGALSLLDPISAEIGQ